MKRILVILLAIVLFTLAAILLYRSWPTPSSKPVVAASIFPLADIVQNVAGDTLTVLTILPPNGNPHTFEPTPLNVKALTEARAFYKIGAGFDDWIDGLVKNTAEEASKNHLGRTAVSLKSVTDNIALRPSHDVDEGPVDPHYWLTIENAKHIADTVAADLSLQFPEYAATFALNRDAYILKLNAADTEMRQILTSAENKNLITMHDAWYYFADSYGLTVVGSFEPTGGKEPTPQYLAELANTVSASGVQVIYLEPQSAETAIRTFAQDHHLSVATLDDLGGSTGKMSYIDLLLTNAYTIANNQ